LHIAVILILHTLTDNKVVIIAFLN